MPVITFFSDRLSFTLGAKWILYTNFELARDTGCCILGPELYTKPMEKVFLHERLDRDLKMLIHGCCTSQIR